jgi:hypothetical protein
MRAEMKLRFDALHARLRCILRMQLAVTVGWLVVMLMMVFP